MNQPDSSGSITEMKERDRMDNIKISVLCLVYNHEKFIRECLDSLVNQKTDFEYEILIHDDASTDSSQSIIREFEKKYPKLIKPVYQKENQYSKKIPITETFLVPKIRGKYVAICEGDDFWVCEQKLQKQYDFMVKNPQCTMYINAAEKVDMDSLHIGVMCPFEKSGYYGLSEYINKKANIPTASIMTTAEHLSKLYKKEYRKASDVGDIPMHLYMFSNGDVYYDDSIMSAYRINNPDSWVGRQTAKSYSAHLKRIKHVYDLFDDDTKRKYTQLVKEKILKLEFRIFLLEKNLKEIRKLKYKKHYKRLSVKEKLSLHIRYYMQFMPRIFNKR